VETTPQDPAGRPRAGGRPSLHLRPATLVTGLVLTVAGLMFAASATASGGTDLRADRYGDLADLARAQAQRVDARAAEVDRLEAEVDALTTGRDGDPAAAAARDSIARTRDEAGVTEVSGPGLSVALDDAPRPDPDDPLAADIRPDDLVVHQEDVQSVVNALWRGGARGIQVMDQRLVSTSAVRCVGNTLILQGRVYSPPFVITAVGDVADLRRALDNDVGVSIYRSWADTVGLGYDVTALGPTTLPPYEGSVSLTWASPGSAGTG
jgi:uncharacterized protein YlxW (UPF0749 family)